MYMHWGPSTAMTFNKMEDVDVIYRTFAFKKFYNHKVTETFLQYLSIKLTLPG